MVNYIAVLVASIVLFLIRMLWYSPLLFGNLWMKSSGFSKKDIDKTKKKGMGKTMLIVFITTVVMVYVLSYLLDILNYNDSISGAIIGFIVWLGFLATTGLGRVLWEGKTFSFFLINALHELVSLIVIGAILGAWG